MERYTPQERGIIVSIFLTNNRSVVLAQRAFRRRFPNRVAPTGQTFRRLAARLEQTGTTKDLAGRGRHRTGRSAENIAAVAADLAENKETSIRRRATQLGISRRTLQRILVKDLRMSECKQNFPSSSKLESHKKIHTREKPFACFYCSKAFKDDYGRKRHARRMHPNENHQSNNETDLHDQTEIVISTSELERSFDLFEATEAKVMTNNSEMEYILQVSEGKEVWTEAQKRADVTAENEILSREPKKMVSNSLISEVKIGLINALKDTFTNLEGHQITHIKKEPTNDTEN